MKFRVGIITCKHFIPERKAYFLHTLRQVQATSDGIEIGVFYNTNPQFCSREECRNPPPLDYGVHAERSEGLMRENYQRAFEWATEGTDFGIVFEDDIDLRDDWISALGLFFSCWRSDVAFASLYTAVGWERRRPVYALSLQPFYGTQAILFRSDVWRRLVRTRSALQYSQEQSPFQDMWIKDVSIEMGYRSYLVQNPGLVQHLGKVSALGCQFHESHAWER